MTRASCLFAWCVVAVACSTYDESLKASSGSQIDMGGSAGANMGGTSASGGTSDSTAGTTPVTGGVAGEAGAEGEGGELGGGEGGALAVGGDGGVAGDGAEPIGTGSIKMKRWDEIPGWSLADIPVDTLADNVSSLTSLDFEGQGVDYGVQLQGFLTAPLTGEYRFWIACDNNCALRLSRDESTSGLEVIALISGQFSSSDPHQWDKYPMQASATLALKRGTRYRLDVRLKQSTEASHLSVAWQQPGQTMAQRSVVPGSQLTPEQ
jgi:hypothetical protein